MCECGSDKCGIFCDKDIDYLLKHSPEKTSIMDYEPVSKELRDKLLDQCFSDSSITYRNYIIRLIADIERLETRNEG